GPILRTAWTRNEEARVRCRKPRRHRSVEAQRRQLDGALRTASALAAAFGLGCSTGTMGFCSFWARSLRLYSRNANRSSPQSSPLPVASGVVAGGSLMGVALAFWANGGSILSKLFAG